MIRISLSILLWLLMFAVTKATDKDSGGVLRNDEQQARQDKATGADESSVSLRRSLSPYLIESFLDLNEDADLKQIWSLLKMEGPDYWPSKCEGRCIAETFDIETDNDKSKTVALRISLENERFAQYLFFTKPAQEGWKFIAHVNSLETQNGPPRYRIERGDGRTWFVIRELWNWDLHSEVSGEQWYEIKDSSVKQVHSYPVEGRVKQCEGSLGRSYKSIPLRQELENGTYTIAIQILVSYGIVDCRAGNDPLPLFSKAQKIVYVWDSDKGRFVLDASRSEIAEEEIMTLHRARTISKEKFLQYNFYELLDIAQGTDARQKDWLKKYLADVKDNRFKAALEQVSR